MRQLKITKSITNRDDASLDKYLQEISREDLIDALEEVELAQKIREWDEKALQKLCKANLRFVVSVAKQYQNQWLPLPDLINEGNLGLIKAAPRFDEKRGFRFISYAVWRIRQSILAGLAEVWRPIRLPLNKIWSGKKIYDATQKLEQKLERQPSREEIAEFLEINIEDTIDDHKHVISLDQPLSNNDGYELNIWDTIVSTEFKKPDADIEIESLKKDICRSLNTLTDRQKEVIELFFGLNGKDAITLEEIGDIYDLTRERVRQIKEKAMRILKHNSKSKLLIKYLWN